MAAKKWNGKLAVLSCSVALTTIVGCQQAPLIKNNVETTVNHGAVPNAVAPPATDTQNVGTNPNAADPNTNQDNSNNDALDKATPMHISAAAGGTYKSDDGLLTAIFPPGSLSKDTDVRLVRVDTGNLKNSDVFLNGIRYQWDLGDAYIMPGTKVTVTSKADDRLVPALKAMYTDFTMERYSLSKDDNGNYFVTMSYKGTQNAPAPLTGPGDESVNRGTMQEGSLPVTGKNGEFKADSRIEAFCNYQPPPLRAHYGNFDACVRWTSDSVSGLDGQPAYENPSPGSADDRVFVTFSTSFVNAPLPPEYKIKDTIPAVPAREEVDTDQYGNVIANLAGNMPPADYVDTVNKANDTAARAGTYVDFCGNKVTYSGISEWKGPGAAPANPNCAAPAPSGGGIGGGGAGGGSKVAAAFSGGFGLLSVAQQRLVLIPAQASVPAQEVVDESNVVLSATNHDYVTGGHPFNGSCNCGGYVTQDDGPVIKYTQVFTDASGKAHTEALQSYNSRNCSAGICSGGPVNFTIVAQASTRYPDWDSDPSHGSLGCIGLYGDTNSQDSAAGVCMPLTLTKNSPFIRLDLTDSNKVGYSGTLVMEYHLDGGSLQTLTWPVSNGAGGTVTEKFFMPGIKDDADHTVKVDRIYTKDTHMTSNPRDVLNYQAQVIRRNNFYKLTVDMLQADAK